MTQNGIVVREQHALANPDAFGLTPREIDLVKRTIARDATDDELVLFLYNAKRRGLDPLSKQMYFLKIGGQASWAPTVDGMRLIAARTGLYQGQAGPMWCGKDGKWVDVWLDEDNHPSAAKVGVYKTGFREPLWAVATWKVYAQYTREGKLTRFWEKMPDLMISKAAETLALRRAFPQELEDLPPAVDRETGEIIEHPRTATRPTPGATVQQNGAPSYKVNWREFWPKAYAALKNEYLPKPDGAAVHRALCVGQMEDWIDMDETLDEAFLVLELVARRMEQGESLEASADYVSEWRAGNAQMQQTASQASFEEEQA